MSMTKRQKQKRAMIGAVAATLNMHSTAIAGVNALVKAKTELENYSDQIDETSTEKGTATKGKRQTKEQAKTNLVRAVVAVGGALAALGNQTQNIDLIARTDFSESDLKQQNKNELLNQANAIHALANEMISQLGDYGITPEILSDFEQKIAAYDGSMKDLDSSTTKRQAARKALIELFKQTDQLLNKRMDRLMEQMRETHPSCYNAYKAARVIKDIGVTHREKPITENTQI